MKSLNKHLTRTMWKRASLRKAQGVKHRMFDTLDRIKRTKVKHMTRTAEKWSRFSANYILILSMVFSLVFGSLALFPQEAQASMGTYVGSLVQPTSTGNQVITGVGFQPKVVLFFMNQMTADGSAIDSQYSFGVGVSSSERIYFTSIVDDAAASSNAAHRSDDTKAIGITSTTPTVLAAADIVTMDSDGFTLNWTTADANARIVNFVALGGSDLTDVKAGSFDATASTGNQTVTGVGFQPDSVMLFTTLLTTGIPAQFNSNSTTAFGIATSPTNRAAFSTRVPDGQSTMIDRSIQKTNKFLLAASNTGVFIEADLVSMNADGFTFNKTTAAAGTIGYLALKGGQFKVGSFNQPGSTGDQGVTGVGFQPSAVLMFSGNAVTSTANVANARATYGAAASASQRFSIWRGSTNAVPTSIADSNLDRGAVLKMMTEGTPTVNAEADFVSNDSDGFTINWSAVDATAREVFYLAIGANPGADTTTLGDGTDGSDSTVGPGAGATEIGRFSLQTSSSTDEVTGLTVTLGPTNAYQNIGTVLVLPAVGPPPVEGGCSATPSSNTVLLTLCSLSVSTSIKEYKIMIYPYSHAGMPAVPGASYDTTATVTSITATNSTAGTDTDSATITVDNASPAGVTSSTATPGSTVVDLAWTNPEDVDFDEVVVLRRATSAVADVPVEGTEYSAGNTIGTATVVCATSSTSCQDTSLTNGTAYHYEIFTQDSRGNYDAGVVPTGSPATPVAPATEALSLDYFRWVIDNGAQTAASYFAAENTAVTEGVNVGDRVRLRMSLANSGSASANDYHYLLEYAEGATCPSGSSWTAVGDYGSSPSSVDWMMDVTSYFKDGGASVNDAGLTDPTIEGGGGSSSGTWYDASWTERMKITVPSSMASTTLTNFPVYVDLSTLGDDFWNTATSSCADVRITTSDKETELPREIASCDTGAKTGELHFKADSLSSTANTDFYIYYGNATSTDYAVDATYGAENVWTNGYVGVWHLQEDGNTTSGGYKDSSSGGRDATGVSLTTSSDVAGQIGNGQDLDGSADYLTVSQGTDDFDLSALPLTVQAWVHDDTAAGSLSTYHRIISWYDGSKNIQLGLGASSVASERAFYLFNDTSGNAAVANTGDVAGGMRSVSATFDGTSTYKMYVDGQDLSGGTLSAAIAVFTSDSSTLYLGQRGNGAYVDGIMDETRISSTTRSTAWIATEYANQSSPSTFYATSTPETYSAGGTFASGFVMSDDAQSPALTLGAGSFTELEYSIRSTSGVNEDTQYCFRLTNVGSATGFTYTVTPKITVTEPTTHRHSGGTSIEQNATPDPQQEGGGAGGGDDVEGGCDPGGGQGQGAGICDGQEGGGGSGGGTGDLGFWILFHPFFTIRASYGISLAQMFPVTSTY